MTIACLIEAHGCSVVARAHNAGSSPLTNPIDAMSLYPGAGPRLLGLASHP